MGELRDGEKSWDHMLKPGVGFYTLYAVRRFLKISGTTARRYCGELDIDLAPFVRNDVRKKTYKAKLRWLTQDEARRLIEHHNSQ